MLSVCKGRSKKRKPQSQLARVFSCYYRQRKRDMNLFRRPSSFYSLTALVTLSWPLTFAGITKLIWLRPDFPYRRKPSTAASEKWNFRRL